MHRKRMAVWTLVVGVAALGMIFASAAGSSSKVEPFKAAWIYVGPHNDGGWSQAHDEGRLYVQKTLGSKVQTTYKENVPEGPQVAAGRSRAWSATATRSSSRRRSASRRDGGGREEVSRT